MRSSLVLALVLGLVRIAAAQGAAPDDLPPPPPEDPTEQTPAAPPADPVPDVVPDPTPDATPDPAPADPAPAPLADEGDKVSKKKFEDRGLVLGFEIGFGAPGGNSGDVYGPGLGIVLERALSGPPEVARLVSVSGP